MDSGRESCEASSSKGVPTTGARQQLQGSIGNFIHSYRIETTKIDGTFAEQTRAASHVFVNDMGARIKRRCGAIVGGSEQRDLGKTQRRRQVHWAGIVGDKQRGLAEYSHQRR